MLVAMRDLNGSATPSELLGRMAANLDLPNDYLDNTKSEGKNLSLKMGWARSHLKIAGLLDNPRRGQWALTSKGGNVSSETEVRELVRVALGEYFKASAKKRKPLPAPGKPVERRRAPAPRGETAQPSIPQPKVSPALDVSEWQSALLLTLAGLSREQFERLCLRLLVAVGIKTPSVTNSTEYDSVEGVGTTRVGLASFSVCFRITRNGNLVQPSDICSFRGSLLGRADKGIYITTGAIADGAAEEAARAGAPAISLLDGKMLCEELMRRKIGVRKVRVGLPEAAFFEQL